MGILLSHTRYTLARQFHVLRPTLMKKWSKDNFMLLRHLDQQEKDLCANKTIVHIT
jgi:hypothetical protein